MGAPLLRYLVPSMVLLQGLVIVALVAALRPWTIAGVAAFTPFSALGVFTALIANSTGVGGGVVFVPAFSFLRETGIMAITPDEAVGTSFAIQCFGMSMGSCAWIAYMAAQSARGAPAWLHRTVVKLVALVLALALPVMLAVQYGVQVSGADAFVLFKAFSLLLGALLLMQLVLRKAHHDQERLCLTRGDWWVIGLLAMIGGAATGLFSVGLGEILALYLFLRRFPLTICVAPAVIVSAVSVLIGVVHHALEDEVIGLILLFTAPGVMLGGFLARRLATRLGVVPLKLFAGVWITGSSAILIAMTGL